MYRTYEERKKDLVEIIDNDKDMIDMIDELKKRIGKSSVPEIGKVRKLDALESEKLKEKIVYVVNTSSPTSLHGNQNKDDLPKIEKN